MVRTSLLLLVVMWGATASAQATTVTAKFTKNAGVGLFGGDILELKGVVNADVCADTCCKVMVFYSILTKPDAWQWTGNTHCWCKSWALSHAQSASTMISGKCETARLLTSTAANATLTKFDASKAQSLAGLTTSIGPVKANIWAMALFVAVAISGIAFAMRKARVTGGGELFDEDSHDLVDK
mmetsp:Transcript_135496/g.263814  ORF Transcript_135496/g.263814 Transcript_135496/m.263814 type:complete len:183 (+) Transcript_135496:110-658(+)|eukprot:CAMPEP_0172904718 /NCGR_PEP_ID=MMETSP1075-20121228/173180_1 /TAXON_ID=2916 /ORGANISM="Ceratium fusus, Strain PA161109" /LENGTH=182 /DNA_ID=CAMNT_0013761811 /DNA_START=17 /DNA_END=565 /DNA_ORIENTATION=+